MCSSLHVLSCHLQNLFAHSRPGPEPEGAGAGPPPPLPALAPCCGELGRARAPQVSSGEPLSGICDMVGAFQLEEAHGGLSFLSAGSPGTSPSQPASLPPNHECV